MSDSARLKDLIASVLILILPVIPAFGQLNPGGLIDFEIRKGGADSSPLLNQTPNDKLNIFTPTIRIFGSAGLSDRWFLEVALQSDYYEGDSLSPVFFSAVNLNWFLKENSDLMLTIGRFFTPYGRYSRLILSSDNPFVNLPLSHSWYLPADPVRGYYEGMLDYDKVSGQSMIYQRMYSQGLMLSNSAAGNRFRFELAATLSPASGRTDLGNHNRISVTGRAEASPAIWADMGISFSYGPYMRRSELNSALSERQFREFSQTMAGADLSFSYLYYMLALDLNYSRWTAPYITDAGVVENDDLILPVWHAGAELHGRFSFLPGAYAALRYEILRPSELRSTTYAPPGQNPDWATEVNRVEIVAGYRIERNIILKLSYQTSALPGAAWEIDDDVVAFQISALF